MARADPRTRQLGVDLVRATLHHLDFLRRVNSIPALRHPDVIRRAVHRYETLWLPLAAKNGGERLPAPFDVEWAWHCHMLTPVAYQHDCLSLVGEVVDHELLSMKDRENKLKRSRRLWEDKFPKEPFDVNLALGTLGTPTSFPPSRLSYDIPAASDRQAVFNYQVSLPHFRDSRFLKAAVQRYRKFLYLKKQNPGVFLAPCYDMDIIWHSHQLHPLVYLKDTESILGRTYDHNDAVNDRSEGSKLSNANSITRELWKTTFNENYSLFGAMYRGDPPTNQLVPDLPEKELQLFASKVTTAWLERLVLKISVANFSRLVAVFSFLNSFVPSLAQISELVLGPYMLRVLKSDFQKEKSSESLWGPVPLRSLPKDPAQRLCEVATHKIVNHLDRLMYTVRVVHSEKLVQSAVHVLMNDRMVTAAHLVSSDTLPCPNQVEDPQEAVYLNPVAAERAFVIKNHKGDWAFVVGAWKGVPRSDKPGTWSAAAVKGSAGTLLVRVWVCGEDSWETIRLPYESECYSFKYRGMEANLKTGDVKIPLETSNVAERLSLVFAVSALHVLCQPRPAGWGEPGWSNGRALDF